MSRSSLEQLWLGAGLPQRSVEDRLVLKDRALDVAAEGVLIADARLPDRPIIYANEGFERMSGYSLEEAIGRNCRFLQGPDTDPAATAEIRAAVAELRPSVVLGCRLELSLAKTLYASKSVDSSARWRQSCRLMLNEILLGLRQLLHSCAQWLQQVRN